MERAFQHLELNHSQIEKACRLHFQNNGSLQSFEILSGGAVNTTYKICWGDEWYVLRFYIRDENLGSIEKLVYQLIQGKVPIPEMLFASSENGAHPFAIFRFCKKPHIYDASKMHAHKLSYELGQCLAKIHGFTFPEAGLFRCDLSMDVVFENESSPYFEYCLDHLIPDSNAWMRLGGAKAKQVVRFIEEHREYFPVIRNGGCLVHSDFKPVNLLWSEEGGLTVLDWEFAHSGDGIMDFGILLRHFQDFPLSISHLAKGYRENGGILSSDWIQRARITDFINIIQLLNMPAKRPKLFQGLIQSLDMTLGQWDRVSAILEKI
jgi:aminoglycoside phosphotransferase (APT) family kinase protein